MIETKEIIKGCTIELDGYAFTIDWMPIELGRFEVVASMDWLAANKVEIVCGYRMVRIPISDESTIEIYGKGTDGSLNIISCMKARKLLKRGCLAYLGYVLTSESGKKLVDIPVIKDFPEYFQRIFQDYRHRGKLNSKIDLVPGARPVARAPYSLAPLELQELMKQLQELSDMGFIRPSSSPWGAPILFV